MRVFVAGLYSVDEHGEKAGVIEVLRNIERGTRISASLIKEGYDVFCPWLDHMFAFYEPDIGVPDYKRNSMAWLEVSDVVLVISGDGVSSGVEAEIKRAYELDIPVYFDIYQLNMYHPATGGR